MIHGRPSALAALAACAAPPFAALGWGPSITSSDVIDGPQPSAEPLPAKRALLALSVARYSLKFALSGDELDAVAEHFRAGGCLHHPHAKEVERLLVMRAAPAREL